MAENIYADIAVSGYTLHPSLDSLDEDLRAVVLAGVRGDKGDKGDTGEKGDTGATGLTGATGNGISTITLNADYTLTIGTTDGTDYTVGPIRGAQGERGIGIANITLNADYTLTVTDSDGNEYTTAPIRGEKGDTGDAATISVGTVTTGAAGSSASVVNSGTSGAAVFDFVIPQGDKGNQGDKGEAATIAVGNVSSGATPSVTNSGTSAAAVFDFVLPKGDTGDTGATGNGIASIAKTSTVGKVDTYTITYTNGTTSTFTVTNGQDGQGAGDMLKSVYDTNDNGIVDKATADAAGNNIQNTYATKSEVPTATSDLTNDSGFITSSALPTKVSDLQNDSGFTTNTGDMEKSVYDTNNNGIVDKATGDEDGTNIKTYYAKKTDLPTDTSDLTNGAGYITSAALPTDVSDLNNDAGYVIGSGTSKIYVSATEPSNPQEGDIWIDIS